MQVSIDKKSVAKPHFFSCLLFLTGTFLSNYMGIYVYFGFFNMGIYVYFGVFNMGICVFLSFINMGICVITRNQ